MKKSSKLRLFALAMTLAVALAGCGSNVASADEDDQQAGNEAESTQGIDWPQKAVTVVVPPVRAETRTAMPVFSASIWSRSSGSLW